MLYEVITVPVEEIAKTTLRCLRRSVPTAVPGIVFLSGGQTPAEATERLSAMNAMGKPPWELSFSYGRALQEPVLQAWKGIAGNVPAAQKAFYHRSRSAQLPSGRFLHRPLHLVGPFSQVLRDPRLGSRGRRPVHQRHQDLPGDLGGGAAPVAAEVFQFDPGKRGGERLS